MQTLAGFSLMCSLAIIPARANILDEMWGDRRDPFFNHFNFPFPIFGEQFPSGPEEINSVVWPPSESVQISQSDPFRSFSSEEKYKPFYRNPKKLNSSAWLPISELLSAPEMSRKRKTEGRKPEGGHPMGPQYSLESSTGEIAREGSTSIEKVVNGFARNQSKANGAAETKEKESAEGENRDDLRTALFSDHIGRALLDRKHHGEDELKRIEASNDGKSFVERLKNPIPRGLKEILIIFQKGAPKSTLARLHASSEHSCDENCANGKCETTKEPRSQFLDDDSIESFWTHYNTWLLVTVPILLVLGTILVILEMKKFFTRMKAHSVSNLYGPTSC